jgi:hypothetical protein
MKKLAMVLNVLLAAAVWAADPPSVQVSNQAVTDDTVTIAQVVSDGPGWMVIHKDANGPGPVVGYAAVKAGVNSNVVVKIDSYTATPKLYAMLHVDAGKVGTYEFPGADVPAMVAGKMVSPSFVVTDLDPRVTVADQPTGGTVTVAEVLANGPGWLVVHADKNGAPGPVIGWAPVSEGLVRDLKVTIDSAKATPVLYAMLHVDAGKVGTYEFPGPDVPVMVDGNMVSPAFKLVAASVSLAGSHTLSVLGGKGTLVYGKDAQGGLSISLTVETTGWIGVGLGSSKMDGATIFMGYVKDGKPVFSQQKGSGHTHSAMDMPLWDQESVTLDSGKTTLGFHLPAAQIPYQGNQLPFIVAWSGATNLTQHHDAHDTGVLSF